MSQFTNFGMLRGTSSNPNPKYPWNVTNYETADKKWSDPKNYTKMLRSYASQGLQQYSIHPSAYTKEMENDTIQQYTDTVNAQADKTNNQFKTNMARTGIAGQPVAAANAAQLGYERGKDIANKTTDVRNQFAVQRQEDWEDWLNYLKGENNQDKQFKFGRDQLAANMAQFNINRGDNLKAMNDPVNKILPWARLGMGALGSILGANKGENVA